MSKKQEKSEAKSKAEVRAVFLDEDMIDNFDSLFHHLQVPKTAFSVHWKEH